MSKPGGCHSSGISLGDALRLPKRHPAWRRREAQSGSRKKLTCSGHAANSRRYRDLGSTCLCRGREWLDLNGVAKVGQSPPPGLRRRRGAPVNKKSRKRAPGPMTARGDSLGCSKNPGSNLYAWDHRAQSQRADDAMQCASIAHFMLLLGLKGHRVLAATPSGPTRRRQAGCHHLNQVGGSALTIWTILKTCHKSYGLSAAVIERMLRSSKLPPRARAILVE